MYFPVADIEISPWVPPLVAFAISFLTSMGGVSGAFLLLPFQVSVLGFNTPAVSATNQLFNILAIPSGAWRYAREGRLVWPLVWIVTLGTLPGVFIGAIVRIRWLADPATFTVFVGLVLLYLGGRLALDLLRNARRDTVQVAAEEYYWQSAGKLSAPNVLSTVAVREFNAKRLVYEFCSQRFEIRTTRLALLCLVVGIVGGIYGIGGGAIIAPYLVAFAGLPVYTAAGAALMATFVTSLAAVVFYQALAPLHPYIAVAPDWALGLLFGLGGIAGMYGGARLQKLVPARVIKTILAVSILVTAFGYLHQPFLGILPSR